jgi:hypothetical protein
VLTPKTSVVPPGGFHYIEKHDGVEIRIESHSFDAVVEAVLRYRVNNGLPPGNPQADVYGYVCGQWPHFCTESGGYNMIVGRRPSGNEPLSRRIVHWMTLLWRMGAGNEAAPETAKQRAAICAECPFNSDFRAGGCGSCIDGIERLGFTWLRQRSTPSDKLLKGCRITGQYNLCAVQAQVQPPLQPGEWEQLPAVCWRKPENSPSPAP